MSTDWDALRVRVPTALGDCLALDCSTGETEQWLLHAPDGRLLGRLARPEPYPAWWAMHPNTGQVLRVTSQWPAAVDRLAEQAE